MSFWSFFSSSSPSSTAQSCSKLLNCLFDCLYSRKYTGAAVVLIVFSAFAYKRWKKPKLDIPLAKNPIKDRVYLYEFHPIAKRQASPYCMKVEAYLKMSGIEYETILGYQYADRFSRHKLPVIEHNRQIIQDSSNIIEYLDRNFKIQMDSNLDSRDLALSTMITNMVENHLGPIMLHFRWTNETGWKQWSKLAFSKLPFPLSLFVPNMLRRGVIKTNWQSGVGRYPEEELLNQAKKDFDALANILSKSQYILGSKFHIVDASVYGMLCMIMLYPIETPLQRLAFQYDSLISYVKRIDAVVNAHLYKEKKD